MRLLVPVGKREKPAGITAAAKIVREVAKRHLVTPRKQNRTLDDIDELAHVAEEGELYLRFGGSGGVSVESISGEPLTYYIDPATGSLVPVTAAQPGLVSAQPAPVVTSQLTPAPTAPDAAALTAQQIQGIVRAALAEERATAPAESLSTESAARRVAAIEGLERAIDARIGQMEARLDVLSREQAATQRVQPQRTVVEVAPQEIEPVRVEKTAVPGGGAVTVVPGSARTRFIGLHPLLGVNFDDPSQGLVGLRGEFVRSGLPYRLVPEILFGFGDDETTFNVNLNGIYDLGIGVVDRFYPYGGLGLGFLNRDELELVFNLIVGSDIRTRYGTFFLEYMNQDLDNNRLLGAYRVNF